MYKTSYFSRPLKLISKFRIRFFIVFASILFVSCHKSEFTQLDQSTIEEIKEKDIDVFGPYAVIKLPIWTGVKIHNPVKIIQGPDKLIYVANHTGEIYTLHDIDNDGLEDHAKLFCDVKADGLRSPVSIIFKDNDLYVGTAQEIRIYSDTDGDGAADSSRTFFNNIPHSEHPYEWTSGLTFGQDGYLYAVLTTDSWNVGAALDPNGWRGAILRISPDGKEVERFATGLRSVHSMLFNEHNDLLFIDNGGGGNPTEELNLALAGKFYGHNKIKYNNPESTEGPIYSFATEVAPAGMVFNPNFNDFGGTSGDLFVSFFGPGERWERGAISRLKMNRQQGGSYQIEEIPVAKKIPKISDLAFGSNGDLYITHVGKTDYWYQPVDVVEGAIYRMVYAPWVDPLPISQVSDQKTESISEDILAKGKQLYADKACSACHSVDGKSDLLGPDLKDVGRIYSKTELLEEINEPSLRIKASMNGTKITKKDGEVLLGRIVGTDRDLIRLMVIGNRIIDIPRAEIQSEEPFEKSLMYSGLLSGMTGEETEALLSYLINLKEVNEIGGN
jgi:putative heme-binding domain-containing protein